MKLSLGSGKNLIKGYTNIDILYGDIVWDLNKGLPQFDDEVTEVLGMHILEHLTLDGINKLLDDIYEVLVIGGLVVFELPDIEEVFKEYLTATTQDKMELMLKYVYGEGSRKGQHHYWGWDKYTLPRLMELKGFRVKVKEAEDYHSKEAPCFRIEATK